MSVYENRSRQITLTVLGVSGLVMSFVPFAWNVIPFTDVLLDWAVWDTFVVVAAPCIVLPAPISVGYAVWLVTGRLPRWTTIAGYALATFFALGMLVAMAVSSRYELADISLGLLFLFAFSGAAWLCTRETRDGSEVRGLVAMQSVYTVPMTYFLVAFAGEYQTGAWLGLVTLLAYLGQISLSLKRLSSLLVMIVPIACIALLLLFLVVYQ